MLFSSITFLFMFLPIVMAVYYLVPNGAKNIVLLLASLFFYAWGELVWRRAPLIFIHRIKLFLRTGYRGKCRQSEKGKAKSCVCSYGKYSHTWIF